MFIYCKIMFCKIFFVNRFLYKLNYDMCFLCIGLIIIWFLLECLFIKDRILISIVNFNLIE